MTPSELTTGPDCCTHYITIGSRLVVIDASKCQLVGDRGILEPIANSASSTRSHDSAMSLKAEIRARNRRVAFAALLLSAASHTYCTAAVLARSLSSVALVMGRLGPPCAVHLPVLGPCSVGRLRANRANARNAARDIGNQLECEHPGKISLIACVQA